MSTPSLRHQRAPLLGLWRMSRPKAAFSLLCRSLLSWVSRADSSLPSVLFILQKPGARSVCPTLAAGLSVCPWPYPPLPFPRSPVLFPGGHSPGHFILPLPLPHPLYLSVTCLSSGILMWLYLSSLSPAHSPSLLSISVLRHFIFFFAKKTYASFF